MQKNRNKQERERKGIHEHAVQIHAAINAIPRNRTTFGAGTGKMRKNTLD